MKSRKCRGGSQDLYRLIVNSKVMQNDINIDKEHLQIVSGIGHTFIRYKDDTYNRYIYIDPTLAQFDPTFSGIFVGDEADLRSIADKQKGMKGYTLDLSDYLGPPLTIETSMMNTKGGGTRKKRNKKTRHYRK
jgi:hypothetical protein